MNNIAPYKSSKLKTPQSLIHINHNMTILQYKYWIIFLHHMKNQLMENIEVDKNGYRYISFEEISEFLGYTPKKSEVYEDLKRLRSYSIEYNVLEKDGEVAKVIDGFLYSASVSSKRVGYVLPPVFIQAMLDVDKKNNIFQLLNWEVFNSFNGKYEAIIYKLCKDYEGVKRTPYMTIEDFRKYIGLELGEYKQFFELNRWTIKKPIKSINESLISDILIDVHFRKKGRKVAGLYFSMKPKTQELPKAKEKLQSTAFSRAKVTISPSDQKKYLKELEESEILATIERANEYAESLVRQEKEVNIGAIYKKAFAERWGIQYIEQKRLENEKKQKQKEKQDKQKEAEILEKKKREAEEKQNQEAFEKFMKLSDDEKEYILNTIQETLTLDFFRSEFKKKRKEGYEFVRLPPFVFELKKILK